MPFCPSYQGRDGEGKGKGVKKEGALMNFGKWVGECYRRRVCWRGYLIEDL